jgi:hypothetical protein
MKRFLVLAALVCPAAAYAEQTYTNADLARFQVPGAYGNEDLRRLPPAPPSKAPAPVAVPAAPEAPYTEQQAAYDALSRTRAALAAEQEIERRRIEESESAFAGNPGEIGVRLGHRARVRGLVLELGKRIQVLDAQIEAILESARRAGVIVDRRGGTW